MIKPLEDKVDTFVDRVLPFPSDGDVISNLRDQVKPYGKPDPVLGPPGPVLPSVPNRVGYNIIVQAAPAAPSVVAQASPQAPTIVNLGVVPQPVATTGYILNPSFVFPTNGNMAAHPDRYSFPVNARPYVKALRDYGISMFFKNQIYIVRNYNTTNGSVELLDLSGTRIGWLGNRTANWEVVDPSPMPLVESTPAAPAITVVASPPVAPAVPVVEATPKEVPNISLESTPVSPTLVVEAEPKQPALVDLEKDIFSPANVVVENTPKKPDTIDVGAYEFNAPYLGLWNYNFTATPSGYVVVLNPLGYADSTNVDNYPTGYELEILKVQRYMSSKADGVIDLVETDDGLIGGNENVQTFEMVNRGVDWQWVDFAEQPTPENYSLYRGLARPPVAPASVEVEGAPKAVAIVEPNTAPQAVSLVTTGIVPDAVSNVVLDSSPLKPVSVGIFGVPEQPASVVPITEAEQPASVSVGILPEAPTIIVESSPKAPDNVTPLTRPNAPAVVNAIEARLPTAPSLVTTGIVPEAPAQVVLGTTPAAPAILVEATPKKTVSITADTAPHPVTVIVEASPVKVASVNLLGTADPVSNVLVENTPKKPDSVTTIIAEYAPDPVATVLVGVGSAPPTGVGVGSGTSVVPPKVANISAQNVSVAPDAPASVNASVFSIPDDVDTVVVEGTPKKVLSVSTSVSLQPAAPDNVVVESTPLAPSITLEATPKEPASVAGIVATVPEAVVSSIPPSTITYTFDIFNGTNFDIGGGLYEKMFTEYYGTDGSIIRVTSTDYNAGLVRLTHESMGGYQTIIAENFPTGSIFTPGWSLDNINYSYNNSTYYSTYDSFDVSNLGGEGIVVESSPMKVASVATETVAVPAVVTLTTPQGTVVDYPTHYVKEFDPPTATYGTGQSMHLFNFRWDGVTLKNGYPHYISEEEIPTSAAFKKAELYATYSSYHGIFYWSLSFPKQIQASGWDGWTTSGATGPQVSSDSALPDYSDYSYPEGFTSSFIQAIVPNQVASVSVGVMPDEVNSVEVARDPEAPGLVLAFDEANPPPVPVSDVQVVSENLVGSFSPVVGTSVIDNLNLRLNSAYYPTDVGQTNDTVEYKYYNKYVSAQDSSLEISTVGHQHPNWDNHLQLQDPALNYPTIFNGIQNGLQHPVNGYLLKNVVYDTSDPRLLTSFDLYQHSSKDTNSTGSNRYGSAVIDGVDKGPMDSLGFANNTKYEIYRNSTAPHWPEIKINAPILDLEIGGDAQAQPVKATIQGSSSEGYDWNYEVPIDSNGQVSWTPPVSWNDVTGTTNVTIYWKNADDLNVQIRRWDAPHSQYADAYSFNDFQQIRMNVNGPALPSLPDSVSTVETVAYTSGTYLVTNYYDSALNNAVFVPDSNGYAGQFSDGSVMYGRAVSIKGWAQQVGSDTYYSAPTHYLWVYCSTPTPPSYIDLSMVPSTERVHVLQSSGIYLGGSVYQRIAHYQAQIQSTHTPEIWLGVNYYSQHAVF